MVIFASTAHRALHSNVPRGAKDAGAFTEAQVSGDDDAGAFIQLAQKVEEQRAARGAERQISQLIHCPAMHVYMHERGGSPSRF